MRPSIAQLVVIRSRRNRGRKLGSEMYFPHRCARFQDCGGNTSPTPISATPISDLLRDGAGCGRQDHGARARLQRLDRCPDPLRLLLDQSAEADRIIDLRTREAVTLDRLVFDGRHDQRLHHRFAVACTKREQQRAESAAVDRRSFAVDRILVGAALALFGEVDGGYRVRDNLQADLGAIRGRALHAPNDAERPARLAMRMDRDERAEGHRVRNLDRRHQLETRLRHVPRFPWPTRRGMRADAPARQLVASGRLVADAPEHRDVHRAVEALAGRLRQRNRLPCFLLEVAGDLLEADDRVDVAAGGDALASTRERLEFRIDLRGELREQRQLLASARRAAGQRLDLDLLLERDHVLHHDRVQWPRVEKQHAAFQRTGSAATQAFATAEVDKKRVRRGRLERQSQRRAPVVELAPDELHLLRGQAARVHQVQHERAQVLLK